jgi:hypothetical protein
LIGVPVALTPGFEPHFDVSLALAVVLAPPPVLAPVLPLVLLLLLLPQAETKIERPAASTKSAKTERVLREPRCFLTAPPPRWNTSPRRPQRRVGRY